MSTGETRIIAFLSGAGFSIASLGMLSMPPIGRTIIFLLCLAFVMVVGVMLTQSHVTQRALRQDDDDEYRKAALRGGRGAQVVVQSPRGQQYQPPPTFYQQPAQLPQGAPQQGMPIEQDLNIGG